MGMEEEMVQNEKGHTEEEAKEVVEVDHQRDPDPLDPALHIHVA